MSTFVHLQCDCDKCSPRCGLIRHGWCGQNDVQVRLEGKAVGGWAHLGGDVDICGRCVGGDHRPRYRERR